ncbi:hypothetical protein GCM10009632_19190 [Mycolicibacterium alvei]
MATVLGVVADLVVRVVALVDRVDPAAAHSARWVPHRERLVVPERWPGPMCRVIVSRWRPRV